LLHISPEVDNAVVVLLGKFNPVIFQPWWLAYYDVIGEQEAKDATIEINHPDISKFQTEYLFLQADRERLVIQNVEGPLELVKDCVLKIFNDLLPHTPLTTLGINRDVHFDVGDFFVKDALGKKLAPWEPWGDWADYLEGEDLDHHGGLINLHMQQRRTRKDKYDGYIRAVVQPSSKFNTYSGIYMNINNHYDIKQAEDVESSKEVMLTLDNEWNNAIEYSEFIINQIMSTALEIKNGKT